VCFQVPSVVNAAQPQNPVPTGLSSGVNGANKYIWRLK
jgi:hypothetical protein